MSVDMREAQGAVKTLHPWEVADPDMPDNCWIFDCSSRAYIPMRADSETQLLLSVTHHYSNIVPPVLAHTTSDYDSE